MVVLGFTPGIFAQEVATLEADSLGAQVAGRVVGDLPVTRPCS